MNLLYTAAVKCYVFFGDIRDVVLHLGEAVGLDEFLC